MQYTLRTVVQRDDGYKIRGEGPVGMHCLARHVEWTGKASRYVSFACFPHDNESVTLVPFEPNCSVCVFCLAQLWSIPRYCR